MKKIVIILGLILFMAGCDGENSDGSSTESMQSSLSVENTVSESTEGYSFFYNNTEIVLNTNAAPVIAILGTPQSYFESPSCAFQGKDKFYNYNSFEIDTYPIDEVDYIYVIKLLNDSISTPEGAYIGCTLSEVKAAYGDNYTEKNGFYTYTLGKTSLEFVTSNDKVTEINYIALTNK